ncbi:MAG TPA: M14 family metallopeptidase [Gemmatimonadales bacterium]|nr:M14 family metallopeptidase [Gemmatimonadales bacterium]
MSSLILTAIVAGVLLPAVGWKSAPAQQAPLTIGTATAAAGRVASGWIEVPAGVDAGTRIPITVVRGSAPGPTLALVAGTHGSEVAPILGLHRLRARVDPATLRGTLLLVHVANLPSFLGRTIYYSPVDGKNLNRVYPGKADGTVSERIAHAMTQEIIERADYLVDMHAGDGNESLRPYTYWNKLGLDARADSIGRDMALAWGHDHIIVDTARPRDPAASVYTQNTAHIRGKPAITTETGYLGEPNEAMIERNVEGALRLLRYFRMLPGAAELVTAPVWFERTEVLRSPHTGVWHATVERGQTVQAGTLLGYVTDFFGARLADLRAPFGGEVLYIVGTPAMTEGEPVGMVGQPRLH